MKQIFTTLFFLNLCLASCTPSETGSVKFLPPDIKKDEEVLLEMNMMDIPPSPPSSNSIETLKSDFPKINQDRKLIKEGDIMIESDEPQQVASAVKQQVQQLGGYISNESIAEYVIEYTLHIPAEKIDVFLEGVGKLKSGKVKRKHLYIRDITSIYVDTESRINSKKQQIEVYTKLLQQAKSVNDVLEVEKARSSVQEDLEAMITEMNSMKQQLSYSKVSITITTRTRPDNENTFWEELVIALSDSMTIIKVLFYGLIRIWFLVLLGVGGVWAFKKWYQRSKPKA